jgi:hypothetical protein
MAQNFTFAIEDKEDPIGSPAFALVDLTESLIGANTWVINRPNNWIGTGSGEYKASGNQLELRDGSWDDERTRLVLQGVNYPGDLKGSGGNFKRGTAQYVSEARGLSGASCEWSGRNIVPDEF